MGFEDCRPCVNLLIYLVCTKLHALSVMYLHTPNLSGGKYSLVYLYTAKSYNKFSIETVHKFNMTAEYF